MPNHEDATARINATAQMHQQETKSILEQKAELARAKAKAITDLLDERVALSKTTAARLDAIAGELKALGWHRTRTALDAGAEARKSESAWAK